VKLNLSLVICSARATSLGSTRCAESVPALHANVADVTTDNTVIITACRKCSFTVSSPPMKKKDPPIPFSVGKAGLKGHYLINL
jgi:hypothetical protein